MNSDYTACDTEYRHIDDLAVRLAIAGNQKTAPTVLAELANDPHMEVRKAVAYNIRTPIFVLAALANDTDAEVRLSLVLRDSAVTPEILSVLAADIHPQVQLYAAANAKLSVNIIRSLVRLSEQEYRALRCAVAGNLNAPPDVLEKLAHDDVAAVRECVAANPSTPIFLLEYLSNDVNVDVRDVAKESKAGHENPAGTT